ncbi:MAG: recombinase family protein [Clostridia bacterium]
MVCGYIRVSTIEQNISRQEETMKNFKVERVFIDKVSGKNKNRPKLQELLEFVRDGDVVVVSDFSRLARNTGDLLELSQILESRGVSLVSSKENIDTKTATGKLMLTLIGAIATFERDCLLERQREGIEIAKAKGVYKGRKRVQPQNFDEMVDKYNRREIKTKTDLAKNLGISRKTLYSLMSGKI